MRDDLVKKTVNTLQVWYEFWSIFLSQNILSMLTLRSPRFMPVPTKGAYSVGYLTNEHGTISAFFSALLWQHRVRFESLFQRFQRKLCKSYVLSSKYHAGDPISILNRKHLSSYSLEISESTATLWVLCREMPPRWEGNFMVDWILWRCQMPKQPKNTTPRFDKSYEHRYLSKFSRLPSSRNERSKIHHTPRDDCLCCFDAKCCFQFGLEEFNLLFLSLAKTSKPFGSISHLSNLQNQMTPPFWIAVGSAPVLHRRAGQGDMIGEVVRKTQLLKKHRRSLSTSQKTPGCKVQSSEATLCFFKR